MELRGWPSLDLRYAAAADREPLKVASSGTAAPGAEGARGDLGDVLHAVGNRLCTRGAPLPGLGPCNPIRQGGLGKGAHSSGWGVVAGEP